MKNKIELLGHYGSDATHACSAWTSTSRDLPQEKIERIPQLLRMLATEGHHTPFEKSSLHFLIDTDIASHIHIIKHRIGVSVNAKSARYKEFKSPTFFIPPDWPQDLQERLEVFCNDAGSFYRMLMNELEERGISRKRAKESARFCLPYATQIQSDVMFNWRSFHHFLGLRMKPNAQIEIKEIAQTMLLLVSRIHGNPFKHTIEAFGYDKYLAELPQQ